MKQQRQNRSKASANRQQPRIQVWKKVAVLIFLTVVIVGTAWVFIYSFGGESAQQQTGYANLVGNWSRPDGDYIICIRSVDSDGKMQAAYFNPNPINVAQAKITSKNNTVKFFLELQDVGYPGSKYELVYKPDQDILQGTYFQARDQDLYDVVFMRKN